MRVLVVDDSALMRTTLTNLLRSEPDIEVRTARDGRDALVAIREYDPDVVTLDVNMPGMDGLTCLSHIMTTSPRPVVMISSLTAEGTMATLEALAMGAFDFVPKPGGTISVDMTRVREEIVAKVRAGAQSRRRFVGGRPPPRPASPKAPPRVATPANTAPPSGIVVIGASTGGPAAVESVLCELPATMPLPIVIAQHMPGGFTKAFAERLASTCSLKVIECDSAVPLTRGLVVVARGDADMIVTRRGANLRAVSVPSDASLLWHPSVERLVRSVGETFNPASVIGVQLTGMGNDGARAFADLHARGAHIVAEAESTAVVWGMPGALVALGGASTVLPMHRIGSHVAKLCEGGKWSSYASI